EAIRRFTEPVPVLGGPMLAVAVAGLLANLVAFLVLNGGDRKNLNVRSAWLHVLGDLVGFIIAIVAALIILRTGWSPIDPILSVLVALR
ncbi:cation transporter, partial [Salmonella enterica]|uniref:cation transporter n=1 Tax=Salmonella enterica TaxID=28901 RepID=UPI003D2903A7